VFESRHPDQLNRASTGVRLGLISPERQITVDGAGSIPRARTKKCVRLADWNRASVSDRGRHGAPERSPIARQRVLKILDQCEGAGPLKERVDAEHSVRHLRREISRLGMGTLPEGGMVDGE
jgi:hypothetical protein